MLLCLLYHNLSFCFLSLNKYLYSSFRVLNSVPTKCNFLVEIHVMLLLIFKYKYNVDMALYHTRLKKWSKYYSQCLLNLMFLLYYAMTSLRELCPSHWKIKNLIKHNRNDLHVPQAGAFETIHKNKLSLKRKIFKKNRNIFNYIFLFKISNILNDWHFLKNLSFSS